MTRALVNSISVMLLKSIIILYSVILVSSCATPKQNASVDADKGAKPKAVSQVTPTGVDAAWQKTVKQNSKKAFIDFVKLNRDTRYTAEVIKRLEKYATARQDYSISAIRPPNEKSRTISRFKITKDYGGGKLDVDGIGEYVLNPATGKFENKFWDSGAEHTILCVLTLHGYTFLSDSKNPLVFQTSTDQGYVYRGGRGLVIEPDGALIALGKTPSEPSSKMSQPLREPTEIPVYLRAQADQCFARGYRYFVWMLKEPNVQLLAEGAPLIIVTMGYAASPTREPMTFEKRVEVPVASSTTRVTGTGGPAHPNAIGKTEATFFPFRGELSGSGIAFVYLVEAVLVRDNKGKWVTKAKDIDIRVSNLLRVPIRIR